MTADQLQQALQGEARSAFAEPDLKLLQHALATIAYRTQKAVRGASDAFASFDPGHDVRTPQELVRHMASVLGYACTFFAGGTYRPEPLGSFAAEIDRFHENLQRLSDHLASGRPPVGGFADLTPARLLQGPLADVLTHAGQLALLRRLAGEPIPPENFVHAAIDPHQLGPAQPEPVSPDAVWPEAPTRGAGASVLPDVLAPGLSVVFCGTAAGIESARRRAYYAGQGNAFWPTLFEVGLTPRVLKPREYRLVLDHGIGLTDLAKEASGPDRTLEAADFSPEALRAKVLRFAPRILAFTSKNAAQRFLDRKVVPYGLLPDTIGETRLFVLPSPSGMARGHWDLTHWAELAQLARAW